MEFPDVEILSFKNSAKIVFEAAERYLIGAADLKDPYLIISLRILNLIEVEEEGEIFDKVSEKVSLLQIMQFLNRKDIKMIPHKIVEDSTNDPIRLIKKIVKKVQFSPQEISDLSSMFLNLNPRANLNIDNHTFVTAAQVSLEQGRIADAVDFCRVIMEKKFNNYGGWEICYKVVEKCESISNRRALLNFVLQHCRADKLADIIGELNDLGSEEDEIMDTLFPTDTLQLISTGVKRFASNNDEEIEPDKKRPRELDPENDPEAVQAYLTKLFLPATSKLEDSVEFSTALACLLAAPNAAELIESLEHNEPNLLLICCFLAGGDEADFSKSIPEVIRYGKNRSSEQFQKYYRRLINLIRGDSLADLGVDPDQFINDPSYRHDTILGLGDTDDPVQLELALELAGQYDLDPFTIHTSFMENYILTSPLSELTNGLNQFSQLEL